ncbi:DNA-3-methyladenine glycosylase 2 family protein [Rhodoferax sp.]|uniref:DNA-3-methyladenine glycosylase 2 family protein n=1 Tax=Rhodoferax sp. TaxID=50421 RepID=UPI002748E470|nr:AlkA N-terminal domain-containing protein [Rhodoferax sp.]
MALHPTPTHDDACYLALKAKDARFDGCFFTGVTSTGIYCRPVCRVRTPKRENCRFFEHAAQAEQAGFRPCLRCRPELAPRSHTSPANGAAGAWSMQDASRILAWQAANLLDAPDAWGDTLPSASSLATRLGVSDRHLRRIFEAHLGVSPLQYLQTRRLLCAKQLLRDTSLPVTQVAALSGFASLRRFNAAFVQHYRLAPSQVRAQEAGAARADAQAGLLLRLAYRPPYDVAAMLGFFETRAIAGHEQLAHTSAGPILRTTVRVERQGISHAGWISLRFNPARCQVEAEVSDSLREVLPVLMHRLRALLDLDADPMAINATLHGSFPAGDGLRVPGTLDGFELAVRAVLGQQITVAAARTLAARLVQRFGEPVVTPWPGLDRLFPTPQSLAHASADELGQLGIVRQRQAAIVALANAVQAQTLSLHIGADVPTAMAQLIALPGIGSWTANYIAMRALRWSDAFPAGDVALHKAMGLAGRPHAARDAELASQAWQPWRSYAVLRAWHTLGAAAPTSAVALSTKPGKRSAKPSSAT